MTVSTPGLILRSVQCFLLACGRLQFSNLAGDWVSSPRKVSSLFKKKKKKQFHLDYYFICVQNIGKLQQIINKGHMKSLMLKLAKEVHWGLTTTICSGKTHLVSFESLHFECT